MQPAATLVIATRNQGKIAEITELLADRAVAVRGLDDFGPIPHIEEDGTTFEENAYKKASFTARVLGLPALADDSGLVVPALNGAPGVHSARFAGENATDADRCRKLLNDMKGLTAREAAFECVMSIAVPTGQALTYEARCEGVITEAPAGEWGFGYDPVFYFPPMKKTFAEMRRDEKNRVSHRGKALAMIREEFDDILKWLDIHMPIDEKFICQKDTP